MAVLSALALLLATPVVASAVEHVVTTTADGSDGTCNAHCTLREAIAAADPSNDSVTVPAGTYDLTLGELVLDGDKVNGAGARATVIRGDGVNRVASANTTSGNVSPAITGVTITNGGGGGTSPGQGGGIRVSGTLSIANSHIVGNSANQGGGIYLGSGSNLVMVGSTVAGNTATSANGGSGGGIAAANENQIFVLVNSTVSGNAARDTGAAPNDARGGGIAGGGGTNLSLQNVTLANNEAGTGNGGGIDVDDTSLVNTILADNTGGACRVAALANSHHSLITDGSCGLTGPGNLQGVGAQLGALANNGGPTDTRALAPTSPAINAGSGCQANDQRGVTRDAACDMGAFEYRAPTLTVSTSVVNDQGGTAEPAEFRVHVRSGGVDVGGSPAPGSGGTGYTLAPGSFQVAADALRGYTFAYGGSCAADGSVALAEGGAATCTIVASDPAPTLNKSVNGTPESGTVKVKLPGRNSFRILREGEQLPNGTVVDTLKGRISLTTAAGGGKISQADFYDGIFKFKQAKGLTTLTLVEQLACASKNGKKATAAAAKKKKRRLWGDGKGRFQTKGKHSAATVVGTKWLVEDTCTTTLTRVVRGKVKVEDFVKRKTITLKKGKRYTARAKRR